MRTNSKIPLSKLTPPVAVALVVAACNVGSGSSLVPSTSSHANLAMRRVGSAQQQLRSPVVPACPAHRTQPRCLVLVHTGVTGNVVGWTAPNLESAYSLTNAVGSKGSGQIVAIVDAYDNPNVAADLAKYRARFGLPRANFTKYNQNGQQSNYPAPDSSWGIEIDLDVEMASAACPNCTIYLIEANKDNAGDAETAEAEAVTLGAHIVSNSWGCSSNTCVRSSYFNTPGVTYVAAAGDNGYGTMAPMAFASVVAAGGTVLSRGGGERGWSEVVWPDSGAGCAFGVTKPSWQHDPDCSSRTANDVSAVAVGVAEYDSYAYGGWITVDGTSISSPFIAGLFGLAGNATSQNGARTFWNRKHEHRADLNHVTVGNVVGSCYASYLCVAGTRQYRTRGRPRDYSGPTGWGTPNGIGAF
ncbi:MAG: S8 family serine peptidase [Candidatus Cybelea sp.]